MIVFNCTISPKNNFVSFNTIKKIYNKIVFNCTIIPTSNFVSFFTTKKVAKMIVFNCTIGLKLPFKHRYKVN